jgi:D-alanyl-lipoteichoic acid acyltransferase DltB (MBOAT superfamily)
LPQLRPLFVVFAGVAVALYWAVPPSWRPRALALSSALFLLLFDPADALAMGVLVAGTWTARRHPATGIIALLAIFCALRGLASGQRLAPMGFGFLACRLIAWLADRELHPEHSGLDFFSYSLFWPTVVVGPIHRFDQFMRGQNRQRWDARLFAEGLERILIGYAKITVLANWLLGVHFHNAMLMALNEPRTGLTVLAECLHYGFQLYFTFAGCSDIGIGLALLLGFRVRENFHWPFLQRNLSTFWEGWHASLSLWCRQYVFLPAFSRTRRTILPLVGSMLALACWHELSGRYVIWGVYHAVGLSVLRLYRVHAAPRLPALPGPLGRVLATGLTVSFVMLGFVFTKNPGLAAIADDLRLLVSL